MSPHNELLQKIGIVRSRWKAFLWVRGLAWVLGVAVASMSDWSCSHELGQHLCLDCERSAAWSLCRNRLHRHEGSCPAFASPSHRRATCALC